MSSNQQGTAPIALSGVETARLTTNNHAAANGRWRNVAIALGRQPPDAAAAGDYRDNLEQLIASTTDPVGVITVIRGTSTPTPDGREALVKMFRDLCQGLDCVAFVVQGTGFAAASQRGIMSGFLLVTGLGARMRIFSTVDEAVHWMAPYLVPSQAGTEARLVSRMLNDVVHTFCERYS